jgi:inositol-phosphate transport system permease protein
MAMHDKKAAAGQVFPADLVAPSAPQERDRWQALWARLTAYGFMLPAGFLVILFFFIPMLLILYLSITNLDNTNFTTNILDMETVGTDNFETLQNDQFMPKILFNTIFYVTATLVLFNVGMALVISLLSTHINRRAGFFFRALWILPRITPSVVYILMWKRMIADPPGGLLNQINGWLGKPEIAYLQDEAWVFVIVVNGFIGASFGMIIFTSAIESIPKDLLNASLVDGSSIVQRIRYVILPLLRWPLLFVVTYQTLSLLTSFEYILLLTQGGPRIFQTEVWALTAYNRAINTYFSNAQWGYGSAFAVTLVVVGVVMAAIYMRVFRFDELVAEPKIEVL